jgi:hypothetical protein
MRPYSDRLPYACMRCQSCHRLLTRINIVDTWNRWEKGNLIQKALCPCGGNRLSPTNPLLWEELFLPRVWKLWWVEIARPWLEEKLK